MKYLFVIICSLFIAPFITAQEWVTDDDMEKNVMVNDNEVKVLYFTASWCGPCKMMKPIMKTIVEDESVKTSIFKMDIDKNSVDNLMNVRSVPTYYFIRNGKLLGSAVGARSRETMVGLISKYDASSDEGTVLSYELKPSKFTMIAGAHAKLTLRNLNRIWYNGDQLNTLAWNIYTNLVDEKDISCALVLIQRSIELKEQSTNLSTYAHLLHKSGDSKKALKVAKNARKIAKKTRQSTQAIDSFIAQLQA